MFRHILALFLVLIAPVTLAQDRGPVTNLPLPRFVSLKSGEANVRRGPSMSHRIDWVYTRALMPLEVVAEYGHWRKVRDRDGLGGWVHYSLLSGNRSVIVEQDILLRSRPDPAANGVALFQADVVTRVLECQLAWCRLSKDGHKGWSPKEALWGVRSDEVFE